MKSILICFLLTTAAAVLLFGGTVDAWNRQIFNRYSRNLLRAAEPIGGDNEMGEFAALFGPRRDAGGDAAPLLIRGGMEPVYGAEFNLDGIGLGQQAQQQQPQAEVYGIVEPLIEDTPCVDRACNDNDDCCPTGVCVSTYGEGKCVYVYGRKRDQCHRNEECGQGKACVRGMAGNLICQPSMQATVTGRHLLGLGANEAAMDTKTLELKQFGEDCVASSECNVAKRMCCQLQRSHHRRLPKQMCAYFQDPFTCIDIMPTSEDEDLRDARFLSSFSQRRM